MGMFDHLTSDYPLPGNPQVATWQTKSLKCRGDHYRINSNGVLNRTRQRYEAGDPLLIDHNDYQFSRFTGRINFYAYDSDWEYSARFVEGLLVTIKCVKQPGQKDTP